MKKLISSIILIVLVFNFISANTVCSLATTDPPPPPSEDTEEGAESKREKTTQEQELTESEAAPSNTAAVDILEEGEASRVTGSSDKVSTSTNSAGVTMLGTVLGVLALFVDILAFQVDLIMGQLSYTTEYGGSSGGSGKLQYFFSLERTFFNRVPLFDIDYFSIKDEGEVDNSTYTVGTKGSANAIEINISSSINSIKRQVAFMFQVCRVIALIIGFLVLLYIGIRMAISSAASEKGTYKKMFISWVESVVLLFLLVHIMVAIIKFGNILINVFYNIEQALIADGDEVFEDTVRNQIFASIFKLNGMQLTIWSIMYWCLLFTQIKFFWLYMKRTLMVGFLIVISPFITITYAIDKAGDGKAQSFSSWMKEFVVNVLIQPLHALIYLVFIFTANSLAQKAPLLALAFLLSLGTVEKMIKLIFNLNNLVTLGDVNKFMKKDK